MKKSSCQLFRLPRASVRLPRTLSHGTGACIATSTLQTNVERWRRRLRQSRSDGRTDAHLSAHLLFMTVQKDVRPHTLSPSHTHTHTMCIIPMDIATQTQTNAQTQARRHTDTSYNMYQNMQVRMAEASRQRAEAERARLAADIHATHTHKDRSQPPSEAKRELLAADSQRPQTGAAGVVGGGGKGTMGRGYSGKRIEGAWVLPQNMCVHVCVLVCACVCVSVRCMRVLSRSLLCAYEVSQTRVRTHTYAYIRMSIERAQNRPHRPSILTKVMPP